MRVCALIIAKTETKFLLLDSHRTQYERKTLHQRVSMTRRPVSDGLLDVTSIYQPGDTAHLLQHQSARGPKIHPPKKPIWICSLMCFPQR